MKLNKILLMLLLVVFLGGGCSTPARFTHEEIKHYPLDVQEKIIKGEIMIGMTPQQVRYSWGNPDSVRNLAPAEGKTREEWIYTKLFGAYEERRLLFVDGKLLYIMPEPKKENKKEK
jgi:hypothetical protein